MKIKFFLILIIFALMIFLLTGCYDVRGLETLAYVVAIGLDEGENNVLKLSLQFAVLGNSENGSESSQSDTSTITTVECSSFDSGISLVNSYISKQINLSHCKVIVVSEQLAYNGISEHLYSLVNNIEIRPDCNVIVARCEATEFLNHSKPSLEQLSARYYELILNSSEYSGYTENITISDFYSNMLSNSSQAYAILGGINTDKTQIKNNNLPSYDLDGSYKADETPIKNETSIENMGLAVFNGDKLVGELDGIETLCHLIITNKLENATITIPSPFNSDTVISLYIGLTKNTKNSLELINNFPFIKSKIYVTANILSIDENSDYTDENNLKIIEEYVDTFLKQKISSYLYKTSKEFKSDIAHLGRYAKKYFLTWNDWLDFNWLDNYQNSFFSVEINTTVQSGYLFTKL